MWHYEYTPSSDELYHYGVKGMKWKKRKKINPANSIRKGINSGAKAVSRKATDFEFAGGVGKYTGATKAGRTASKAIQKAAYGVRTAADKVEKASRSKNRKIFDRVMKTELSPSGFRSAKQDIDKLRGKKTKKTTKSKKTKKTTKTKKK